MRPERAVVGGQAHERHGRQGHEGAGGEAVEDGEPDEAGRVVDADPAQGEDARYCRGGEEGVDRPDCAGEECWHDSARDRGCV